jgi:hypothetical protein
MVGGVMTDKPKLNVRFLSAAELRAIDEATPPQPATGYARVQTKAKGWPRVVFPNGQQVVEWQCAFCDEWCCGQEDEHHCTPGNKA